MAVQVKLRVLLDSIQPLELQLAQTVMLELFRQQMELLPAKTALLESINFRRDKLLVRNAFLPVTLQQDLSFVIFLQHAKLESFKAKLQQLVQIELAQIVLREHIQINLIIQVLLVPPALGDSINTIQDQQAASPAQGELTLQQEEQKTLILANPALRDSINHMKD